MANPFDRFDTPVKSAKQTAPARPPVNLSQAYNNAKAAITRNISDPQQREKALERFYSDPRIQDARVKLGLPVVKTREQEIQETARSNIETRRKARYRPGWSISPQEESMGAGAANFLGIGPLASAGANFIGDVLSGRPTKFNRDLDVARTENRLLREEHPAQAFVGELLGGGFGGGAAAKGIQVGARALAPIAPRISQAIQAATTLQRGQKVKNVARIAGAGAAGGAAQAAGEGTDVQQGAVYGAGGALALGGTVKGLGWLGSKASDLFRVAGADALLKRYTSINADELARRLVDFRKRGKGEPTIYELLPLEDRQKFKDVSKRMPGETRERAANLARERVQSIPGEIAATVQQATRPTQRATARTLATDLATSRGVQAPTPADRKLAKAAVSNPTALGKLAREEADNIMRPFDTRVAYASTSDLIPQVPTTNKQGTVVFKEDEAQKDVANMIRNATTSLRFSKDITVSDLTRVLRHLDERAAKGDIDTDIARAAANHIEDLIRRDHPDALEAVDAMKTAWAGKMRTQEGINELRLQQQVPAKTRRQQLLSENVFETPEGAAGRGIGQRLRTSEDLGAAVQPALGTVREIAESPMTQQTLRQNLGRRAAGEITQAAQVQSESARKLATAMVEQPDSIGDIEAGDLALLASSLNPASMAYTKFRALAEVSKFLRGIPKNRANTIVDMLFSRDPAMTQRAVNALKSAGDEGSQALRGLAQSIAAGVLSAPEEGVVDTEVPAPDAANPFDQFDTSSEAGPWDEFTQPEGGESNYAEELQNFYETADPELIGLLDRVEQQESGGDQAAVSPAGAVGVMQVMPETAPEAAQLAGLPWDENAYRTDENYNRLLGIAYLSSMLDRYGGDTELALAAYNAGPGTVDQWLAGQQELPSETQDYIQKVG